MTQMTVQYRQRRRHLTKFENRLATSFAWMETPTTQSKKGREALSLANLAVQEGTRKLLREQYFALRVGKSGSIKKAPKKATLEGLLRQVDTVSASNPIVIRRVVARDGTTYPLRTEITIVVKHAVKTAEAFVHELKWLESLFGKGTSDELAIAAFTERFHHLVTLHHRKPPHLRTEEDGRINRVLDHLIDWNQFDIENPVEQPLWGRVGKRDDEGNLMVYWVIGPGGETTKESAIFAHDVVEELVAIGEGRWFYGAGRVFPKRIEWTSRPVEIPDPHDAEAIKAAWDLIPCHIMSDFAAWPLKK